MPHQVYSFLITRLPWGYLSDLMAGRRIPSGGVLKRLHAEVFAPSPAELVAPVELKVLGWKKGRRNGVVIRGAGGPGGDSIRAGGRVPRGVEYVLECGFTSLCSIDRWRRLMSVLL